MAVSTLVTRGIPTQNAKSFAYDREFYIAPVTANFAVAATTVSKATWASGTFLPSFTGKQLRSLTIVPTTAPTMAQQDNWSIVLVSSYPQNFGGTCTAIAGYVGVLGVSGTLTATASNVITITGTNNAGTVYTAGGSTYLAVPCIGTNAAYNPYVCVLDGGTATVVITSANGTTSNNSYVFPTGPNGGLTINPGDVLYMAKGTDSAGVYVGEAEFSLTPGSSFTI